MAELVYNVTEAAQALGISRRTMYELMHREDFPTLKVGSLFRTALPLWNTGLKNSSSNLTPHLPPFPASALCWAL